MRIINTVINGTRYPVLDLSYADEKELNRSLSRYRNYPYLGLPLSRISWLKEFQRTSVLVLTGGVSNSKDLIFLYEKQELEILVLDFEITNSKIEGIDLSGFSSLRYVLSRSNLNIKATEKSTGYSLQIVNHYEKYNNFREASCLELFPMYHYFFLSSEAETPTGEALSRILKPIEANLNEAAGLYGFSKQLESIAILVICMSKRLHELGFGRNREYVTFKKKYADYRISLDFDSFLGANEAQKKIMCQKLLCEAAKRISSRDSSFEIQKFCEVVLEK